MKLQALLAGAALVLTAAAALPAQAEDTLYVPLMTYRTGAYAGSGIPIADGMHDYLAMLNERDGGIGGVRIAIEECETGYDAQKGVECYEATKGKKPLMQNPWSTGITLQVIPKAAVDRIVWAMVVAGREHAWAPARDRGAARSRGERTTGQPPSHPGARSRRFRPRRRYRWRAGVPRVRRRDTSSSPG